MSYPNGSSDAKTFSQAFRQMCNFTAVAKTGNVLETLRGLIALCFVICPDRSYNDAADFQEVCNDFLGISLELHQYQSVLDDMLDDGSLERPAGTNLILLQDIRSELSTKVRQALDLEMRIKEVWLQSVSQDFPGLPPDQMWSSLHEYMCIAFRRHGMQAVALLDPTLNVPQDQHRSLASILDQVVERDFTPEARKTARDVISGFLSSVGSDPDRASYVVQLADGAFNFYTLKVAPDAIEQLRSRLSDLTIFLDTNFIFGILDLHNNSQVDVSRELVRAIAEHKLPIRLRYHEATQREAARSIAYYGSRLKERHWPTSISRAVARSHNVSGVELKYHEHNAVSPISPSDYLEPYENFDVLLKDYGILIYRSGMERSRARAELFNDYQDFLNSRSGAEKPYEVIDHDVTILDATRLLRSNAKTTLDAGALLVTCDYRLFKFDWQSSRQNNTLACVLLPNVLWQILRPFISSDANFDKSFAETFALPEFRMVNSGAAKACSKMLIIMARWGSIPEDTALTMLSNRALLSRLQTTSDDAEFEATVEKAFVEENATLAEENAALELQLRKEREQQEISTRQQAYELAEIEKANRNLDSALNSRDAELGSMRESLKTLEKEVTEVSGATMTARALASEMEQRAAIESALRAAAEAKYECTIAGMGVLLGIVLSGGFLYICDALPWRWIQDHPHMIGLKLTIVAALFFFSIGLTMRKWRTFAWGTALLGTVLVMFQIVDG